LVDIGDPWSAIFRVISELPCNVIVQELPAGDVEVAAVNPVASMQAIQNPDLMDTAQKVQAKLRRVIENL
jgi:uncharacterized protein (DUF302 family)